MIADNSILAFCHIVKAAGTTFTDLLKKNNGWRHLNVEPSGGSEIYQLRNLSRDLRAMPWLTSLAGHSLRPYVDFGDYSDRLKWITWLRDPVNRLVSGYQHGVEKRGITTSFEDWLREPLHRNRQVYFLSGDCDDLQGAKNAISNQCLFVGFVEHFDECLVMIEHILGTDRFNAQYPKPSNRARKGNIATEIFSNFDRYRDLVIENTELDQQLYDWAYKEHYISALEQSGDILTRAHQIQTGQAYTLPESINLKANYLVRHLVYKPIISKL